MTLQNIDISNDVRQTLDTVLAEQLVRFDVWWQPFDEHWYLSLSWQTGVRVISGVRLVTGADLLTGIVSDFSGSLRVYGAFDSIPFGAWGVSHQLLFDSEGG